MGKACACYSCLMPRRIFPNISEVISLDKRNISNAVQCIFYHLLSGTFNYCSVMFYHGLSVVCHWCCTPTSSRPSTSLLRTVPPIRFFPGQGARPITPTSTPSHPPSVLERFQKLLPRFRGIGLFELCLSSRNWKALESSSMDNLSGGEPIRMHNRLI